ncbi:MAG TPA: hypothetical protein VMX36_07730 [Sedimentisphaerales bacterium]|nr:hypothetical protein [Sedimentisphaerales bacterium]
MNRIIIVTDLTRFHKPEIVCTAGINEDSGECIRPMPYLALSECRRLNVLPGAKLSGDFTPSPDRTGPHQEDYSYKKLKYLGPSSSSEFKNALRQGLYGSVEEGFEVTLKDNQKHIPIGDEVQRSIITVSISPSEIKIIEDSYKPGKIKLNFRDLSGRKFRYIGITDLGFHKYALQHHSRKELGKINAMIKAQKEVYLRIGLSREYQSPYDERNGYWLQANGIYTFPDYNKEIRCYN